MPESTSSGRRVRGREVEAKALELRKSGASFSTIGESLALSRQGAFKAVHRALTRLTNATQESAADLRRIELERCDALLAAHWPAATRSDDPDPRSTMVILRVMERRAKLLGLDAPIRTDLRTELTTPTFLELARELADRGEDQGPKTGSAT